jgi:hypothetical protein
MSSSLRLLRDFCGLAPNEKVSGHRNTSAGTVAPFEENLAGDPKNYLDKLRDVTPALIEAHHNSTADPTADP